MVYEGCFHGWVFFRNSAVLFDISHIYYFRFSFLFYLPYSCLYFLVCGISLNCQSQDSGSFLFGSYEAEAPDSFLVFFSREDSVEFSFPLEVSFL